MTNQVSQLVPNVMPYFLDAILALFYHLCTALNLRTISLTSVFLYSNKVKSEGLHVAIECRLHGGQNIKPIQSLQSIQLLCDTASGSCRQFCFHGQYAWWLFHAPIRIYTQNIIQYQVYAGIKWAGALQECILAPPARRTFLFET